MKTNTTIINGPLVTAALLLIIFAGLSSCNPDEPVKPTSAYGIILPAVVPDTLVTDPKEPEPIPTEPIIVQPQDTLAG